MERLLTLILPLVLLAGCGGDPDAACDFVLPAGSSTVHACLELNNLTSAEIREIKDACPGSGGTVVDACPTDNVIGFCTLSQGDIDAVQYFYATAGVSVAAAKEACEDSGRGTWTPK